MMRQGNRQLVCFSVIIPTYNAAETLRRCLESITIQTFRCFEVILIDGCSTDETLTIIKEFSDNLYIRYISEPDLGIYDAMNKGIDRAKGEWIYFLGSDDCFYDENVLASIAKFAKNNTGKVIYGNVIMRGQNQWNLENAIFDGQYNTEKLIDRNICHQAIFYHRDIFRRNGRFTIKYVTSADFDFNMRCHANTEFVYMDLIIANFFVGGHSTVTNDSKFHQDRGALLFKYYGRRIFSKKFLGARLYLQRAAFLKTSPLNLLQRICCALAYAKLKIQSILTWA